MILTIAGHNFAYEMECVVRIFFPGTHIDVVKYNNVTDCKSDNDAIFTGINPLVDNEVRLSVAVKLDGFDKRLSKEMPAGKSREDPEYERMLGVLLFTLLSELTGKRPGWGILTGIRPVRLCGQWRAQGLTELQIIGRLTEEYLVSASKSKLCIETGKAQQKYIALNSPNTFSLYIGIPFCPTRCLYCSFVSHDITGSAKLVPDYVRLLCEEIRHTAKIATDIGLKLLTVYIGGGTPTTLSSGQLKQILLTVGESFDMSHLLEYTVEAGRPDTVTIEKLETLQSFNVGRISINPQSMNENVLRAIGRSHTPKQTEESFALARQAGFKSINMDLITGLPEETPESFSKSLEKVIGLAPENITVHALTIKRSSRLRDGADIFSGVNADTIKMQDYATERLYAAEYKPYYMYRQKATVENLENIGFSKPNHEGLYNIYSMDDAHNILAAGAGGVSKLVSDSGIHRVFNYKYPYEYINRFDENLKRKTEEIHARYN